MEHVVGVEGMPTPERFDVQLVLLSGATISIEECTETMTIAELKRKIECKMRIPSWEQTLLLGVQNLDDVASLRSAGISKDTCLSLIREEDKMPALVESSDDDQSRPMRRKGKNRKRNVRNPCDHDAATESE